jgi:hypothetical protein
MRNPLISFVKTVAQFIIVQMSVESRAHREETVITIGMRA